MLRAIVGVLGAVAALVPEKTIERFERVALEESGDRHLEPRARTAVRVEGILTVGASLLGGATFAGLMKLTGAFGAVLLLFPGRYQRLAGRLLYGDPEAVEWSDAFADRVRLVGVIYLLLVARALGRDRKNDRREANGESVEKTTARSSLRSVSPRGRR
ncbi:hypothetical protein [Natronococcus jeotgali]|uniref:Uncharacterized protein n=1 Tax=Natronococcus jeotgali DSM 18795 TaxID=1227498 RepID=L9XXE8_9EURY|nr:hypothetical protein [Natronococcus jeotgali]ELY66450.1 hypothetical protein C492_00959 [Natronococcus jeotgali DSM 18795]